MTMQAYSRPLVTNAAVEEFLMGALGMNVNTSKMRKLIASIAQAEVAVEKQADDLPTLNRNDMRDGATRDDASRWVLRSRIINELFTLAQLENDDKIRLGSGGAMPRSGIKADRRAFILIGLPAAGKSGIASSIAEKYGAAILDSDFAKRKLPEYAYTSHGASLVHEESSALVFGFDSDDPRKVDSLKTLCLDNRYNVIIPKIGNNPNAIYELAKGLKDNIGYEVHLILVALPKKQATIRAVSRFSTSKRYVPLGLIFDEYGNDPYTTYYYLRAKHPDLFTSFCAVSTIIKPNFLIDKSHSETVIDLPLKHVILHLP